MVNRSIFCKIFNEGCHKGFYNDKEIGDSLLKIKYTDFFEEHVDEEFPYYSAHELLCGSCHQFALALKNELDYNIYVIEGITNGGFHSFCQLYRYGQ